MKLNTQLMNWNGKPLEMGDKICPMCKRPVEAVKIILRDVLLVALNGMLERESVSLDEQRKRFVLATRIATHDETEFSAAEIVLIEEQLRKFYPPLVTGQVCNLLEPPKEA